MVQWGAVHFIITKYLSTQFLFTAHAWKQHTPASMTQKDGEAKVLMFPLHELIQM